MLTFGTHRFDIMFVDQGDYFTMMEISCYSPQLLTECCSLTTVPVLAAEDIFNVTVYGRIYCLQVDRVVILLHSYRLYRDVVIQQGSLPIYSSRIAVSVVDNVLLIHQVDAKIVILYDLFADSRAPISAPLPLLLRGFPTYFSSNFT
ncbi:hypothetical protein RYX36_014939 [Vicia faba]